MVYGWLTTSHEEAARSAVRKVLSRFAATNTSIKGREVVYSRLGFLMVVILASDSTQHTMRPCQVGDAMEEPEPGTRVQAKFSRKDTHVF